MQQSGKDMLMICEAMHEWGQEVYGKSLYLPLNFAVNLKLFKIYLDLKNLTDMTVC